MKRVVRPHLPDASGLDDGLAWNLFTPPDGAAAAGVVVLHGAGSQKENHHDFARVAAGMGLAALAADLPGHGASTRPMDERVVGDVAALAEILRERAGVRQVALRGSSMGGYLALIAAGAADAFAVVAICPASAAGLRRGLDAGRWDLDADAEAMRIVLADGDAGAALAALAVPVLLLHARGDETVPVEHSRELAALNPRARLIELAGGDHRSVQHDPELQGESVRFLRRAARAGAA